MCNECGVCFLCLIVECCCVYIHVVYTIKCKYIICCCKVIKFVLDLIFLFEVTFSKHLSSFLLKKENLKMLTFAENQQSCAINLE